MSDIGDDVREHAYLFNKLRQKIHGPKQFTVSVFDKHPWVLRSYNKNMTLLIRVLS